MKRSAIILAGGASRRFGVDKGLMTLNGRNLIDFIVESVRPIVDQTYVICSKKQVVSYKKHVSKAEVIVDYYPENSPLIGLITGLRVVKSGYAFVAACDMPFIKTEIVGFLFEQAKGRGGTVVVKPDGRIEPFLCVYHVPIALMEAERLYRAGDLRIRMVVRNIRDMKYVGFEDITEIDPDLISLIDIDTREKLRQVKGFATSL